MGKILIVDDEGKMRAVLAMAMDADGHEVTDAGSAEDALAKLADAVPDVVITDVRLGGMSGLELLGKVREQRPGTEVIVMTAYADAQTGISAMRGGAFEYVAKPFEVDEMRLLVRNALEKVALRREVAQLRQDAKSRYSLDSICTKSRAMQETISQARMVAKRDTTVLVTGRSGTGKELVSRGIHEESGRGAFVAVNCAAIPDNLLESELFGHEKGAFTGAHARKIGLFEHAGNGTILLDEIGDISPDLQVKLLRVLQEREFSRVGGTEVLRSTARVIAATNRNLEEAVAAGEFREDVYYRLNVFPVVVPSLADRTEDLPQLVEELLARHEHDAGVDSDFMEHLTRYAWPGNVRELENCIERAVIIAAGSRLSAAHLPEYIRSNRKLGVPTVFRLPEGGISLEEVEKNLLRQALERTEGNKTEAARQLGISRRAIYSKMQTHGITEYGNDDLEKEERQQ